MDKADAITTLRGFAALYIENVVEYLPFGSAINASWSVDDIRYAMMKNDLCGDEFIFDMAVEVRDYLRAIKTLDAEVTC